MATDAAQPGQPHNAPLATISQAGENPLDVTGILTENIALRSVVADMAGDLRLMFGGTLPDDFARRLSHLGIHAH